MEYMRLNNWQNPYLWAKNPVEFTENKYELEGLRLARNLKVLKEQHALGMVDKQTVKKYYLKSVEATRKRIVHYENSGYDPSTPQALEQQHKKAEIQAEFKDYQEALESIGLMKLYSSKPGEEKPFELMRAFMLKAKILQSQADLSFLPLLAPSNL